MDARWIVFFILFFFSFNVLSLRWTTCKILTWPELPLLLQMNWNCDFSEKLEGHTNVDGWMVIWKWMIYSLVQTAVISVVVRVVSLWHIVLVAYRINHLCTFGHMIIFVYHVLCSTLVFSSPFRPLSHVLTSSRKKKKEQTCAYFCIFGPYLFISRCHFLIYFNLTIYMNKAVRSVECYLWLPSCVFVNGASFEEKQDLI